MHARLSIHLSKCHIVGNHVPRLNYYANVPFSIEALQDHSKEIFNKSHEGRHRPYSQRLRTVGESGTHFVETNRRGRCMQKSE